MAEIQSSPSKELRIFWVHLNQFCSGFCWIHFILDEISHALLKPPWEWLELNHLLKTNKCMHLQLEIQEDTWRCRADYCYPTGLRLKTIIGWLMFPWTMTMCLELCSIRKWSRQVYLKLCSQVSVFGFTTCTGSLELNEEYYIRWRIYSNFQNLSITWQYLSFTASDSPVRESSFLSRLFLFSYKAQEPNSAGLTLRMKHKDMQIPSQYWCQDSVGSGAVSP